MTPEFKLRKARAALITAHPFYGALALRLRLEECPTIPTCDVDGVTLRYSPAFVEKCTVPELTGVFAHEVMHCALGHIWRLGGRNATKWSIAADHAINLLLQAARLTLPKGALANPQFANKSADDIYAVLPDPPKGAGNDPGGCGGMREPKDDKGQPVSPADAKALEQEWKIATIQAANAAQASGNLPAGIERLVKTIKQPTVDWRAILRRFISSAAPSDYSWFPPNRRHVAAGLYLPALRPDRIGTIAVMIDTSGSINADTLAMFSAELNAILEDARPASVQVIYCDAQIQKTEEYTPDDFPVKLKAHGGGGTDFRPPFAWLDEQGIEPVCAIFLTDLYGPFPDEQPYPVLWAATTDQPAPFGEIVRLRS